MRLRNLMFCLLMVIGTAAIPAAGANIIIEIAPPPARAEVVPPPRSGYVWAPGYWRWEGKRHVWVPGRWMAERPGYYWVPERWVSKNGRHQFEPGRWERRQEPKERRHEERDRHR